MRSTRVEPVLLSRLQRLLFSAKVNHLIKCAFYTNTPLKRPKQQTIRIYVINCMPCCNFTVNIGFRAAYEDRTQHRETSTAFFSDSPLTEMNHFCSKRLNYRPRLVGQRVCTWWDCFAFLLMRLMYTVGLYQSVEMWYCLNMLHKVALFMIRPTGRCCWDRLSVWSNIAYVTCVRPLCVKIALICKNGVKVRVTVRVRVRDRIRVRVRVRVRVRIMVSVSSMHR